MSSLSKAAILVGVKFKKLGVQKSNSDAPILVARDMGLPDATVGKYYKKLFPSGAFSEVNTVMARIKRYHDKRTKPWESGYSILPNSGWAEYHQFMLEAQSDIESALDNEVLRYETVVESMKDLLQGMFSQADYPAVENLKHLIKFEVKSKLIPDTDDIRISLKDEEKDSLVEAVKAAEQDNLTQLSKELWKNLQEPLKSLKDRLADEDKRITKAAMEGIQEVLKSIPAFNFQGNQELDDIIVKTKDIFEGVDEDDLQLDVNLRKSTEGKLDDILTQMDGYI